jgi:hypothetical protein
MAAIRGFGAVEYTSRTVRFVPDGLEEPRTPLYPTYPSSPTESSRESEKATERQRTGVLGYGSLIGEKDLSLSQSVSLDTSTEDPYPSTPVGGRKVRSTAESEPDPDDWDYEWSEDEL